MRYPAFFQSSPFPTLPAALLCAAALLFGATGCAHKVAVTSDPSGLPVRWDGEDVGKTPLYVVEDEPYAVHALTVGEGASAVTHTVIADKTFAKDATSYFLMPLSCAFILPAAGTAGTDDRVHVAYRLSGQPIGGLEGAEVELEYLPEDASYPLGIAVDRLIVDGRPVRIMVDRRPFVLSLNYQGLSYPAEPLVLFPQGQADEVKPPLLSFGAEQEWLPISRLGIGVSAGLRQFEAAMVADRILPRNTNLTRNKRLIALDEFRLGALLRYRHPVLHWDGQPGGLDLTGAVGAEAVYQVFTDQADENQARLIVDPWVEAGVDIGLTRAVAPFATFRIYPRDPVDVGGVWGNLGATPDRRVVLGARIFW